MNAIHVGQKLGNWTVVKQIIGRRGAPIDKFECVCSCGKVATIDGCNLRDGLTKRCFQCSLKNRGAKKVSEKVSEDMPFQERWDAFIKGIEQTGDVFLITFFKNPQSVKEKKIISIEYPESFLKFKEAVDSLKPKWYPLYAKCFESYEGAIHVECANEKE